MRSLADKGFSEDSTFWHDFVFKFVFENAKPKHTEREFSFDEAKMVWDSLIYLKLKCPEIDLKNTLK